MTNLLLLDPTIVESNEIRPSVIWENDNINNITYQDLNEIFFEKALNFIRSEYISRNLLCKTLKLSEDEEAIKEYLEKTLFLLKGNCSIIAIDNNTNEIIGIIVMYPLYKDDYSWQFYRMRHITNKAVEKLFHFPYNFITNSKELEENYDTKCILNCFIVAIAEKMKGKLLKEALLLNAYKMARSLGIETITYICETRNNQERARRIGMTFVDQIHYDEYKGKDNLPIFITTEAESAQPTCILFVQIVGPQQNMSP